MKKEIERLLANNALTGDEAGRIMILDLLSAYKSLSEGGSGDGILADEEKIDIVNRLTLSDDIQRFNDYRGVHDFLKTAPAIYDSYFKTFEVYYWRLANLLTGMKHAEEYNFICMQHPVIMTAAQYGRFLESGKDAPPGGIAVLQGENGGNEDYPKQMHPEWLSCYMAENVLNERGEFIREALDGIKDMLAECLARKKALEIIARYVKIPQIKILIPATDKDKINVLNELMAEAVESVRRGSQNSEYGEGIKRELSALLSPVELKSLEPLSANVVKTRRSLNLSVIKNGSEAFIAQLKRKWRYE